MGSWGPGNFENDSALDMVGGVLDVATAEIEAFRASDRVGVEDLDPVVACVAIHVALHARCGANRPDADVARAVRDKVLRIYDDKIDLLRPKPEYKAARRAVLVETLDAYVRASIEDT
jgi:hypothetical protein